ncbi:hypothetical protein [Thermococcus sp.]
MALYEERIVSKLFLLIILTPIAVMGWGTWRTYLAGEGFEIMLASWIFLTFILLDIMAIRIEIDEEELRIRGLIGLIIRKTIRIDDIRSFKVSDHWMKCYGTMHFTFPAKGCVLINRRSGWSVSLSTNNPEELARVLSTLGVPREA